MLHWEKGYQQRLAHWNYDLSWTLSICDQKHAQPREMSPPSTLPPFPPPHLHWRQNEADTVCRNSLNCVEQPQERDLRAEHSSAVHHHTDWHIQDTLIHHLAGNINTAFKPGASLLPTKKWQAWSYKNSTYFALNSATCVLNLSSAAANVPFVEIMRWKFNT